MTQYMLSVHHGPEGPQFTPEQMQQAFKQVDAFNKEIVDAGIWVFGGGLESPEIATMVDATGSETVITDGPYAETKEYLGGFWVIEAPDLDAALEWAAKASAACERPIEVRPTHA